MGPLSLHQTEETVRVILNLVLEGYLDESGEQDRDLNHEHLLIILGLFWSFGFWQSYFNVDTKDVRRKIVVGFMQSLAIQN